MLVQLAGKLQCAPQHSVAAEALLETGPIRLAQASEVWQWRTALDLVAKVEEIRLQYAVDQGPSFADSGPGQAYEKAFLSIGLARKAPARARYPRARVEC